MDFGFYFDVYIKTGCLCIFVYSLITSSHHPLRPTESFFDTKFFLDFIPYFDFLGVFIDFLEFLDRKLGPLNGKLIREIPENGLADR